MTDLFDSSYFMPHGHCYLWRGDVLWLNVLSAALISVAYFSIPIALLVFINLRKDLVFNWIFAMFAAFIFACGTTHILEIWTICHPDYMVQGFVKLLTAVVSCLTAVLLWPLMPRAIKIPSPRILEFANRKLEREIKEKDKIQEELIDTKRNLEMRVEQHTTDLRRANRMKDEFLTTLSHELRTPLNVIMGYADLLRLEVPGSPEFQHAIEKIHRNAGIQAELINDLLDVSRIITGKIQLESQLVDPISVINYAIDAVSLSAKAKHISLETQFAELTGFILGDSTRLQQILWNLLANAIKFSPKGGRVLITTRRIESKLEIRVRDWGRGIDPDFLPYVFDRFRQEDSSTTRAFGGLGLGLAIVRHITELHGGMVFAESEGKGMGSTFIVLVPVMSPPKNVDDPHHFSNVPVSLWQDPFAANSSVLKNIKVLVVDDENDTRILVRSILVRCGSDVKSAESAEAARNILMTWLPDIIVSDIGMNAENGIEFIGKRRASKDRPEANVPAIALTAYARPEDREAALVAGFQAHAAKPIGAPHLIEIILRVLAQFGIGGSKTVQ